MIRDDSMAQQKESEFGHKEAHVPHTTWEILGKLPRLPGSICKMAMLLSTLQVVVRRGYVSNADTLLGVAPSVRACHQVRSSSGAWIRAVAVREASPAPVAVPSPMPPCHCWSYVLKLFPPGPQLQPLPTASE